VNQRPAVSTSPRPETSGSAWDSPIIPSASMLRPLARSGMTLVRVTSSSSSQARGAASPLSAKNADTDPNASTGSLPQLTFFRRNPWKVAPGL
jgi:hypothetical protein